ncbi:hypothetical protein MHBO_002475 [Bonamia ostreae]|uniref:Uncharacterized protein n=1 Tax=Bonamia ostreae TaxID=126728 RepID=A0ABV2AMG0_9EUKA
MNIVLMPGYIRTLGEIQKFSDHRTKMAALELSLRIPYKFSCNQHFVLRFIETIIEAFQTKNDLLIKLSLDALEAKDAKSNIEILLDYMEVNQKHGLAGIFMREICSSIRSKNMAICKRMIRILGKIGGKNRKFLDGFLNLEGEENLFVTNGWVSAVTTTSTISNSIKFSTDQIYLMACGF